MGFFDANEIHLTENQWLDGVHSQLTQLLGILYLEIHKEYLVRKSLRIRWPNSS